MEPVLKAENKSYDTQTLTGSAATQTKGKEDIGCQKTVRFFFQQMQALVRCVQMRPCFFCCRSENINISSVDKTNQIFDGATINRRPTKGSNKLQPLFSSSLSLLRVRKGLAFKRHLLSRGLSELSEHGDSFWKSFRQGDIQQR